MWHLLSWASYTQVRMAGLKERLLDPPNCQLHKGMYMIQLELDILRESKCQGILINRSLIARISKSKKTNVEDLA